MEEMKPVSPFLWNLPIEVVEEIVLHLSLSDRKNARLTCKRLYELCNSDGICRNETIKLSQNLSDHLNVRSDLFHISRSYYNFVINAKKLEASTVEGFFRLLGPKIRSLDFKDCQFVPGTLELIIELCEGLCSLSLAVSSGNEKAPSNDFTFQQLAIRRPNVTHLKLNLPPEKLHGYFHRILSIFPNVKQLQVEVPRDVLCGVNQLDFEKAAEVCSSIFDVMKTLGNNLECLKLNIPLSQSINNNNFFDALPNLKDLSVTFNKRKVSGTEMWYPRCSNLVSVELLDLKEFCPPEMIRLLTNTRLKYLSVQSNSLVFDRKSFEQLVASQLDTIRFNQVGNISGPPLMIMDTPLEANRTAKNLYSSNSTNSPESTQMLFTKYFLGLVHLNIYNLTDSNLQCIFRYQVNLRSLKLGRCSSCTIIGFCGTQDGSDYSISNLRKLEHLSIFELPTVILQSDDFKRAMSLPQLKYLHIYSGNWMTPYGQARHADIPIGFCENLTELRALRLRDSAIPTQETLLSLLSKLKHLSYLRFDLIRPDHNSAVASVTFIEANCKYISINAEKYEHAYSLAHANLDGELNRIRILNDALEQTLCSPKIGSFQIDWIKA